MDGYPTPEDAVRAPDSVAPQYVSIVAVEYSPRGEHAVVFIAYNVPSHIERCIVLCEKTPAGLVDAHGGSGGGMSWRSRVEDGSLGVQTT